MLSANILMQENTVASFSAFLPLKEEANRKTAKVTHGFLSWMDGQIDIATETLYMESYKYTKDVSA